MKFSGQRSSELALHFQVICSNFMSSLLGKETGGLPKHNAMGKTPWLLSEMMSSEQGKSQKENQLVF